MVTENSKIIKNLNFMIGQNEVYNNNNNNYICIIVIYAYYICCILHIVY